MRMARLVMVSRALYSPAYYATMWATHLETNYKLPILVRQVT